MAVRELRERRLALDDARVAALVLLVRAGRGAGATRARPSRRAAGTASAPCPFFAQAERERVCLIDSTMPCVFGTSSVSRSQPVVFAEVTNHFACFAPMSRSIPSLIDSAPSFAIASRGSTPFGQRSLQK